MNWIQNPTLTGETVKLIPLEKTHFPELELMAKDRRIWESTLSDCSDAETFKTTYETALLEKEQGSQFPFVILHLAEQKIIGSTRFLDIQPNHKKLEIGWTWLHPDYWATEVNFECKLLLLTYCFEYLKTNRVQIKADENNIRSRQAIQKIGAIYEGTLRKDMIRDNGIIRSTAYYSLLDSEWAGVKPALQNLYKGRKTKNKNMQIQNSTIENLDTIFHLYRLATDFQTTKFWVQWPEFDRQLVIDEIKENRQWQLCIADTIACVWATTFDDPDIWEEKNVDPAVYIHRIAVNPAFRGQHLVMAIVEWAKTFALQNDKQYIRLDTVGENHQLIQHYQKCGFDFLGLSTLKHTDQLPSHYKNATVSLFQITC